MLFVQVVYYQCEESREHKENIPSPDWPPGVHQTVPVQGRNRVQSKDRTRLHQELPNRCHIVHWSNMKTVATRTERRNGVERQNRVEDSVMA